MSRRQWIYERCEALYQRYNRAEYIDPDPLVIVRRSAELREREIVALLASCLALGRVDLILRAVEDVLERLPKPFTRLAELEPEEITERSRGFVYRFFRETHLASFLIALSQLLRRHGSLETALSVAKGDGTLQEGLQELVEMLSGYAPEPTSILLSNPRAGSASKRLHLFLRWMVRNDAVDPGGWNGFSPAELLVPVDTHMLRIARTLGITERKQADLRTSEEITAFFRTIVPEDPARYDFVLTRFGIRPGFFAEVVEEFGENPYTP
ncbi:MAG: TIGR02757 family protein [Alkalispirochaetaceae bacterium]